MIDFKNHIHESISCKKAILDNEEIAYEIKEIVDTIVKSYKNKGRVLTAGNGGSAGDAQHIAGELVCKFNVERQPLDAIALTSDTSVLTSVSNDLGYENSFARQVKAYARKGDVFIAISTSGNSKNIINAIKQAKQLGVITIGLVGSQECEIDNLCDYLIKIPSTSTPIIQESQIMLEHIICGLVEQSLFCQSRDLC